MARTAYFACKRHRTALSYESAQHEFHETLVTIATFYSEHEFLLARARLESADIECFAQDENMLRMAGWHSHILGGIKLRVRESDAQDALAILHHTDPSNHR
jgi:hypothetical protein